MGCLFKIFYQMVKVPIHTGANVDTKLPCIPLIYSAVTVMALTGRRGGGGLIGKPRTSDLPLSIFGVAS